MRMAEREEQLRSLAAQKGRSASICVSGCSSMEAAMAGRLGMGMGMGMALAEEPATSSGSSTPRTRRRIAAARSQSARVVGSRPRVQKRRHDRQQSPHLDLAGSEPYIGNPDAPHQQHGHGGDVEGESYNPFLRKVPSTGRLMMGVDDDVSESPPLIRRATCQPTRRDKPPIPIIATPENSPALTRKPTAKSSPARTPTQGRALGFNSGMNGASGDRSPSVQHRSNSNKSDGVVSPRRVNSFKASSQRKSSYLDVPDSPHTPTHENGDADDESYILRSFSFTSKGGVINRGDSFRRRRSRSNSLIPTPDMAQSEQYMNHQQQIQQQQQQQQQQAHLYAQQQLLEQKLQLGKNQTPPASPLVTEFSRDLPSGRQRPMPRDPDSFSSHKVAMVGAQGVGKTALISQFMTSECINAYDRQRDDDAEKPVFVMLNGEESELCFLNISNSKAEYTRLSSADAFVIMYSVIDKASFQRAEAELERLQEWDLLRSRAIIIVGNKVDLVRSRAVSPQDGKWLACSYRAKFIEISVGINHNVDELLVGILNQIRLKASQDRAQQEKDQAHWYKSRGIVRASMKARQVFTWLFGKEDTKFKNCENLHVL